MITNCKVTLYTKIEGGYCRTVADAFWGDRKTVTAGKLVVALTDSTAILVPILGNPPISVEAKRDYIVRGACKVEPPTAATLARFIAESGAQVISGAHCLDYGSAVMQHWALEV